MDKIEEDENHWKSGGVKTSFLKIIQYSAEYDLCRSRRVFKFCKMFKALMIFGIDTVPPNMYFHCHLKESDFVAVHKF